MQKRGNILRAPRGGPGLLMIEGRQFAFSLDGVWKSKFPPKPGLLVEVELDSESRITAIAAAGDGGSSTSRPQCGYQAKVLSRLVAKLLGRNRMAT
jgi:hypothetical protein